MFARAAALKEISGSGGTFSPGLSSLGCKRQAPIKSGENREISFPEAPALLALLIASLKTPPGRARSRQGPKRAQFSPKASRNALPGKSAQDIFAALILPLLTARLFSRRTRAQCFNSSLLKGRERTAKGATQGKLYAPQKPALKREALQLRSRRRASRWGIRTTSRSACVLRPCW